MNRAEGGVSAAELLAFLGARGGQEYAAALLVVGAPTRKKGQAPPLAPSPPIYRLTLRGETVQATGPSGQTRQLTRSAFFEVFGAYRFADVRPTGRLSDLGPLFGSDSE
ncbi:hypothetical protein DKM44_08255 [Deinococcus irradiatisoli]|uniref:Uncharacterized protein n=1 Tax=Deinococcus irradiatisoli TaxID=2202254 RepID=A0A2Z3JJY4_9DEIO|nr:hypothetical protein [Deinococcus irradiatisoli]AWN23219.1 hypothetical protein DKM44_08255 [Deinococcus irradiatisoli]